MSTVLDIDVIRGVRERAGELGLARPPSRHRRSGIPKVPDILFCTFDSAGDCFHVVYADLSSGDLRRTELSDVGERRVVAWSVDEFRRGVEVVLDDGDVTSFSAEFPRYLRDAEYRRRVDSRRGRGGDDLGQRVASRVSKIREERGWSVAELARRAGMAAPNVHRVVSGRHVPSMPTIVRLSQALDVPIERLVTGSEEPPRIARHPSYGTPPKKT